MNLYNLLKGVNPSAFYILPMLGKQTMTAKERNYEFRFIH